jgi:mono/diheme cytochrome c family protein
MQAMAPLGSLRPFGWLEAIRYKALNLAASVIAFLLGVGLSPTMAADRDENSLFESRVRPVLNARCVKCHGAAKQESGLRLDSGSFAKKGGDRGPAIVPGEPDHSLLIQAVRRTGDLKMPPDDTLRPDEVAGLVEWVRQGAQWPAESVKSSIRTGPILSEDRQFWSFRPLAHAAPPDVRDRSWPRTPVDRFILARLERESLRPAAAADRRTLIRRVTFDLTGLPPSPAEVEAFVADRSSGAYSKVVDRLLASPSYGERWGRHWLDVVRYADTAGETADFPVREAYRYRNYVIASFNADKPYDQFLREQIAGDLYAKDAPPERYEDLETATGFIAISRRFGFDPENYQHLTIQDTIDTLGQAVLGLSLGCARCHNHKFDPVTTADYYALYGIFDSTRYAFPGSEEKKRPRDFIPAVPRSAGQRLKADRQAQLAALSARLEAAGRQPGAGPEVVRQLASRKVDLEAHEPYPVLYAVSEGESKNARIQFRGEPSRLGPEVPRRFLEVFGGERLPANEKGSGRRELARWVTGPEVVPLAARVIANRIWQHHFGYGLVRTENDFGSRGARPTHPELLDFLATRLVESGWSIKSLHRLILQSQTYQQSSDVSAVADQRDPQNSLLSHFGRRRLDAEEIRDSLLVLGGNLDRSFGGPHPFPPVQTWGFTQHAPFSAVYDTNRRSVYLMTQRIRRHPFLALFDGPDGNVSTAHRDSTTVPTQSLFLMNDPFVHAQSSRFAELLTAAATDEDQRIACAFEQAFARPPDAEERAQSAQFLAQYRRELAHSESSGVDRVKVSWAAFARTLFARNDFLFID